MDDSSNKILESLKKNKGNYQNTAKELLIPADTIRETDVRENKLFGYTVEGKGRPELQQFIVGIRRVNDSSGWNNQDAKIRDARRLYNEGLVELVTGRDGMNSILYAIPRKHPVPSRVTRGTTEPYFNLEAA